MTATTAESRIAHYQYGAALPFLTAPGRLLGDVRVVNVACFILLAYLATKLAAQGP